MGEFVDEGTAMRVDGAAHEASNNPRRVVYPDLVPEQRRTQGLLRVTGYGQLRSIGVSLDHLA